MLGSSHRGGSINFRLVHAGAGLIMMLICIAPSALALHSDGNNPWDAHIMRVVFSKCSDVP
eukprot:216393-Amphidinium_carterae.1